MEFQLVKNMLLCVAAKPRVLHRLPGRLRLHIPLLNQVNENSLNVASSIIGLVETPEEIFSVEPNFITGNVLICYDNKLVKEEGVLALFRSLVKIVARHWEQIIAIPPAKAEEVARRVTEYLKEHITHRYDISERIQLPDDIW